MTLVINFLLLKKNRVNSLMVFYIVQMYYFLFLLHILLLFFYKSFFCWSGYSCLFLLFSEQWLIQKTTIKDKN
ncbi:hypothetical protein DFO77_105136 [Marinilabilia salmonicolor]|jgi:hypothetical protein|uniref:Uncharacterized protein n=1 Tax=Marinilabilia salmonicolor TaxID=989 RepID=A0A2T0XRN2_9BACT|nr:hypothetical protein BY457_10215 [Marinilabilia salmonicolor]RCW37627.1 hypothetical protein DFO77_105136 [Marinilabilia salmonicolor]